jgi:hypothetical protein
VALFTPLQITHTGCFLERFKPPISLGVLNTHVEHHWGVKTPYLKVPKVTITHIGLLQDIEQRLNSNFVVENKTNQHFLIEVSL